MVLESIVLEGRIEGNGEWVDGRQADGYAARALIETWNEEKKSTEEILILSHEARVFKNGELVRLYGFYLNQQYFDPIWLERINERNNRHYF
ncbi:hypothetical protein HY498_05500 [Candidatus Woesearchaeota archaeon]|nr:hypothetical protein [Candidatus Woesearchaeota archaeon]